MVRISDIKIKPNYTRDDLYNELSRIIGTRKENITRVKLVKKAIDARKKDNIMYTLTADVKTIYKDEAVVKKCKNNRITLAIPVMYESPVAMKKCDSPIVVGFGPAGMFASLVLAEAGLNPIVFERGGSVEERSQSVDNFFKNRILNTESNIQFGEGGAGTFSDGKLNTGIKDPRIQKVFQTFVENGAPREILFQAKPHIGTDNLPTTVKNIREKIISLGGTIHFNAKVSEFVTSGKNITGVKVIIDGKNETYNSSNVVLAIGHSARDTFKYIYESGVPIEAKPFAVGARIEHKREMINQAQYGKSEIAKTLPTADYKLAAHLLNGRSIYTFCMCPGGDVVAAASCENSVVTNGMSAFGRMADNSNSALLVGVTPEDYGKNTPLDGMYFQEKIERKAFELAGSNYNAPAQMVGDFLKGQPSKKIAGVKSSYLPQVTPCDISSLFPDFITESIRMGIKAFGRRLEGFDSADAVLTAPETRSSSPIRILRRESFMSVGVNGLYPSGEGAGYAGGITSAAVDGIKCAEAIIKKINE